METKERKITRTIGRAFCTLELRLTYRNDGAPRFSMCGVAGEVMLPASAKRQALENWISFFEESPAEIISMNERCGTRFRSPRSAAKYVVNTDGEYHGLDVTKEDERAVFVGHSFGQIRDEIARFFPEYTPFFKWHLNDMHAECAHQESRGETYATHPAAVCPECGYSLGSAWLSRELPPEVIALFDSAETE